MCTKISFKRRACPAFAGGEFQLFCYLNCEELHSYREGIQRDTEEEKLQSQTFDTASFISGGRSLYITGVTSLARSVEVISPPIMTQARGE